MTPRAWPRTTALGLALLLGLAPPNAQAGRRKTPDVVEDALAFATTDRAKALQLLEDALADEPTPKDLDAIAVHAGEQRRLANDLDAAHRWYTSVAQRTTKGVDAEAARLGMALIEAAGGVDSRILTVLADVAEKDALDTQNADRFLLLAMAATRAGEPRQAAAHTAKALQYATEDPEVLDRITAAVKALTATTSPLTPIELVTRPKSAASSPLDLAEAALEAGRRDDARAHAQAAQATAAPDSLAALTAAYLLRRIDAPTISRDTIAVLLPLSGKYGAAGQQMREAFESGYRAAGGTRRLIVMDSGSSADSAVSVLEQAVLDKGAIAVVGPLLTDETDAVVRAAEALRVPLLSLSRSLEDTDGLAWTVQSMMSPRDEIDALLDAVMDEDGMDAFAVFAPKSTYGERSTQLFRAAVEARGGAVTAVELYDPTSNDLVPNAKTLGRKDYGARATEFRKLKEDTKANGGDPTRVVLPPLLDFDALFVPDSATRVPLAVAALAYEEFPMGAFQPTKESPVVPLLGLSGWNDEQIVATGGPYVRRGYFTDAFVRPHAEWTAPPEIVAFIESYRAEMGRAPTPLEAIVSDAGRLLGTAARGPADTRAAFRDALLAAEPTDTVTRIEGVNPQTHRVERDIWILTVLDTGIVPRSAMPPLDVQK